MAVLLSHHNMPPKYHKHIRRNATAVMAGAFDPRPPRDVLTSLLNGVGPYKEHATNDGSFASTSALPKIPPVANSSASSFWRARPTILIPTVQRSVSVTPSPTSPLRRHASTPGSTPGPSISSSTSHTSSKRPRTPDDDESFDAQAQRTAISAPPPRKKRAAAKKGWKGWVEGSPPPSEKLINLDAVPVLQDRRLRSGKNFDGIGIGTHGWV
ncbi:hypothetical protein BJ912DRAFT_1022184 [Pholiota molesta]|nr:hypothetical protein BJ912DRAFT_1022184 [Pholiota molesta]